LAIPYLSSTSCSFVVSFRVVTGVLHFFTLDSLAIGTTHYTREACVSDNQRDSEQQSSRLKQKPQPLGCGSCGCSQAWGGPHRQVLVDGVEVLTFLSRRQRTPSACATATGDAACAAPSPRSAGCVRVLPGSSGLPLPGCAPSRLPARSAS